MEPTLPVWTVRPNWKGGVLERLEWLTDVLTSSTGVEQRRALRPSPRRSIEITINPTQNERTFVDLLLHKLGSNEWLFPLWFDKARLSVAAELGADRIDFDNTFREFTDGGLALIYKDAFTWEVISIGGQDSFGLDLDVPLDAAWGKNVAVYPLRRARLQNETELRALSSRVGESVLLWTITEANDYPEVMPDVQTFEGMPVLTIAPNRSQDITVNHTRLSVERDNQTGIPYRVDSAGRAFQVQSHSWMLVGRQAQSEFRSMLYWLRGRQRAVWLPSFNEDFVTSRASALASLNLDIQKVGLAYAGGLIPGRDVVRVNGTPARITALGAPQSPQEERLRIGAGLTAAVPAGRRGSFMSPARLNQDGVEIMHHVDTNGAAECSTTFKSFNDTRDTAGAIYYPIPLSAKNSMACGTPGFTGLSWLLPCVANLSAYGCSCANFITNSYVLGGDIDETYEITFRVRGAVEKTAYFGGTVYGTTGNVIKNSSGNSPWDQNVYKLEVSDPPASYSLNHGVYVAGALSVLDYEITIPIKGGATITLLANAVDGVQLRNVLNAVVPDNDPNYPIVVSQPYQGQFMQLDGSIDT